MKRMGLLMAMMAMSVAINENTNKPKKKSLREYAPEPKQLIPNGHKEFIIEGQSIYALNYKNALKKYNNNKI